MVLALSCHCETARVHRLHFMNADSARGVRQHSDQAKGAWYVKPPVSCCYPHHHHHLLLLISLIVGTRFTVPRKVEG